MPACSISLMRHFTCSPAADAAFSHAFADSCCYFAFALLIFSLPFSAAVFDARAD